jgi:spoIIIJ-associated protein
MNILKEFQGKTIDDAIREACDYFGVERERLEIEIVNDATSGIFGLMGGKKASIRASRVSLSDLLDAEPEISPAAAQEEGSPDPRLRPDAGRVSRGRAEGRHGRGGQPDRPGGRGKGGRVPRSAPGEKASAAEIHRTQEEELRPREAQQGRSLRRPEDGIRPAGSVYPGEDAGDGMGPENLPEWDPRNCDQDALLALVSDTVVRLVRPIVGEMTHTVTLADNRVLVGIDCGDSSGLLLGREGQTLAAVQYIAGRIVAKSLGGSLRLQFDAGNYREMQDERLRELAHSLAEKVKASRRSHSTRPLSAYQRRIIHLALEGDDLVQTFSKGEGSQRRVIIQLKRADRAAAQGLEETFVADLDAGFSGLPDNLPGAVPPAGEAPDEILDAVVDGVLEDARNGGER